MDRQRVLLIVTAALLVLMIFSSLFVYRTLIESYEEKMSERENYWINLVGIAVELQQFTIDKYNTTYESLTKEFLELKMREMAKNQ